MNTQAIEVQAQLGPNQLDWLRAKFGSFKIIEQQTVAAREDTRKLHEKYPVIHVSKQ